FQLRHENNRLVKKLEKMNDSLAGEIEGRKLVEADLRRDRQLFTDGVVTVFRWRAEEGWPIEYVSKTISQFGFDADQLMCTQTKFASLIHTNDLARVEKSEFSNGEHGFVFKGIDYRIVRPDGRIFWVYDYTIPLRNAGGEITHYAGYLLDITDRKQTEVALQHEKDRVDVTLKSIGDAVITIDVNGQIEYINPAAENFTGWSEEVAHGLQLSRIFSLFDEESTALIVNEMQRAITERETVQSSQDMVCNRHDGRRHSVQYSVSPILGYENSVLGAVMVIRDFTEHRSMQHKLSHQETHDVLTGLINRNEFSIRLEAELSYDSENHILCFLNLDELKVINDTCSYAAGDEVIKTIAALLPDQLRDTDVLARLDGDQFGFLLKHCPLKDAVEIAEKILSLVNSATYEGFGESIQTTASIGVARVGSGDAVADVMAMVDLACYAAKELGGNRLHVYHDNDKELAQRHDEMRWVPKIKEAIKTDRLVLYFQDIVPVLSGSEAGCHFELLVRMLDENDELVAPGRFLPAAERYHLVALLDRWVIERSFEWYQRKGRHLGADQPLTMAINLSGESVTDSALLEYIKEEMTYYHVPANVICFEITETAAVANLQAAARFIRDLQHIGCRFALDDFGSGMSSFAYLKNLPVDYLKIDGSLVRGIETDTINYAMVNAIHQLGSVMGIKTIAEFVENERTREKLAEIGVDYAQGFGICRPRPLEDKVVTEQLVKQAY
ncbi:MAG: EAL domain-containing protein, partial [Gammaproteobacteria bacterium]|nr:EAL domain-containing protein [Gammaproteobacteria bacterium]